ncbi:MAG TPA: DUF502 domain-containing protein [Alphaproteobacteria bacterium]|nr:DUF502 domain-containing protein [Alphaproteobacteria bacterium]
MSKKTAPSETGDAPEKAAAATPPMHLTVAGRLRAYFFAGILVLAPVGITFYIAYLVLHFVDGHVTPLIPARYNPNTYLPFGIPGLGLVIVVVLVTLVGSLTAGYLGRVLVRLNDFVFTRMPVLNGIYGAVKQLVEAVFGRHANAFRQVVLVEWPREGAWTLALVTTETAAEIRAHFKEDVVTIMVLTTPNPTSGYLVVLPRDKVIPLSMTVEDAMKMILSSGLVVPDEIGAARRVAHRRKAGA